MSVELEDYVPILYNVIFEGAKECYSHSCEDGKCICMDSEQMGLLRKMLSEDDEIVMDLTGGKAVFKNMQSKLIAGWICRQAPKTGKRGSETFFFRGNLLGDKEAKIKLEELGAIGSAFEEVIKSIPVIIKTNYSHNIENRDTLINLCAYAACSEKCIYILFRAVICRTIGCCQRAGNQEEKEQYAAKVAEMFERLNCLYRESNEIRGILHDDIESYISDWYNIKDDEVKGLIRNICRVLEEYRKEIQMSKGNLLQVYEKGKCEKLYCILKKIFETGNVSTKGFPKLEFDSSEQDGTEYDAIIDMLDKVKDNQEKLSRIWEKLFRVFWTDVEVPSESIEEMQKICRE